MSISTYIYIFKYFSEGKIPKGAIYLGKSETMEGDVKHTDTYYAVPTEEKESKMATTLHSPKRYEDIGPLDQESGMPLAFRRVSLYSFICGLIVLYTVYSTVFNKERNAWQKYMILAGFEPGPPG